MTGTERGLDAAGVASSREKHGSNRLAPKKRRGFWSHFASELADPIIRVLIIALVCNSLLLIRGGSVTEVAGILFSILAATFVSTVSGYKAERTLDEMEKAAGRASVRVMRSGELVGLDPDELVVGDIVTVGAGERVHADGMLIDGAVTVDQSTLTGESKEKNKTPGSGRCDPSDPHALLRGTLVTSGEGRMYVLRVGDKTFYGAVSRELGEERSEPGPLKSRLTRLAKQISRLGYAAAALIALADFFYSFSVTGLASASAHTVIGELLHALTLGITVIVVAVPEGLPMMISVVLSANTRRMARNGVMVRRPVGIETAGNMNVLFCDKTGTLTRGILRAEEFFTPDGGSYRSPDRLPEKFAEPILVSLAVNNQARRTSKGAVGGNSTDRALLAFAGRRLFGGKYNVVSRVPFDSAKKYSSVTLDRSDGRTFIKGAPEVVLPTCGFSATADGGERMIDRRAVTRQIAERTSRSARVIAFAVRYPDGRCVYLGSCSLRDTPRREAKRSVETLRRAGVRVVMLTGDALDTAVAVARECGILDGTEGRAMTSAELAAMSDDRAIEILPELRVLARALPSDKSRLVRLCGKAGLVCGMTGDGTNDAPALKAAPVGFAMGSGSEVAREAGDIVILDDDISSIAKALLYGRTVFHSIRKFITFQLTMNFLAVGISLVAPFIGVDTPVTVTQMLWINLIMDTLAGLAFAGEAPREKYMREPPRRSEENILVRPMVAQIVVSGLWTVGASVLFLKSPSVAERFGSTEGLMCGFFCFFVFSGLFAAINSRTASVNLFSRIAANKPFIFIMAGIAAIQIALVFVGGAVFRCVPLTGKQILFTLSAASALIPVDVVRKAVERSKQ